MYFQEIFGGNQTVAQRLVESINKGAVLFTGAGTSMPIAPSWQGLISAQLNHAYSAGRLSKSEYDSLQSESDVLYVADQIVEAIGRDQLYAKISALFEDCPLPTGIQRQLVRLPFSRFVTLNYDLGLEKASTEELTLHRPSFSPTHRTQLEKWLDASAPDPQGVLHWHGSVVHTDDIIFSGDDYNRFYERNQFARQALSSIFRFRSAVMIGFGFSDHFITGPLESVMRNLATDNKHFAILGVDPGNLDEPTLRKKFAAKYKLELVLYPLITGPDGKVDHSHLSTLLHEIQTEIAQSPKESTSVLRVGALTTNIELHTDSLFMVGDRKIYCEPNLVIRGTSSSDSMGPVSAMELAADTRHTVIISPHEYGLTTVGKRILVENRKIGRNCLLKEAAQLPNYKKKLITDVDLKAYMGGEPFTLVLDNYSPLEHSRLSSELLQCFSGIRLVLLQRNAPSAGLDADFVEASGFRVVELYGLRRSDIRTVAKAFLTDQSDEQVSLVVDKVYNDFVQLCIPFTPSNVVMYCSVLYREGDFSPVSRLQIVDKFVSRALQRPSDAYSGAFNFSNRVDYLFHFTFHLFEQGKTSFLLRDWSEFTKIYKQNTLSSFNEGEILSDLVTGGILKSEGSEYFFRYKMFYSYFVGRYIASRPDALRSCIAKNQLTAIDGMVEVLCGFAPDATPIIADLGAKLEDAIERFYSEYSIRYLCLHAGSQWKNNEFDESLWSNVSEAISSGPLSGEKLDQLKSSIIAEHRTVDQKVAIIEFIVLKENITALSAQVQRALVSATYASGDAKIAATRTVLSSVRVAYEVATVFAPMIAERKYFSWNGFAFVNLIEDKREKGDKKAESENQEKLRMLNAVVAALPCSIVRNATERFGSNRIGPVIRSIAKENVPSEFDKLLIFSLILKARPDNWQGILQEQIALTDKNDIFLAHMLSAALTHYKEDVSSHSERIRTKEIIATIRLRHELGLKNFNTATISKAVKSIDSAGYLEEPQSI